MSLLSPAPEIMPLQHDYIYNAEFARLSDAEVFAESPNECFLTQKLVETPTVRGMPPYLLRLCESRLLTPTEERELFRRMNFARFRVAQLRQRIEAGKRVAASTHRKLDDMTRRALADRNRIVQANVRLVVSIAKKFADPRNAFEDLLSEGIAALLRAADKFDYDRGFRFSTYATQAVRRTLYRWIKQRQAERQRFEGSEAAQLAAQPHDDQTGTMTEQRWAQLQTALVRMLGQLDQREQWIIRQRFGLDERREVITLQDLAKTLGVCKERVRQLEQRAIGKLRLMADQVDLTASET